jgi:TetR/AcrR family transcriptional repressor of nem operon
MRVSKATREAHRDAILSAAGRLFRARGIDAVGVAEITAAAGLTHGGFYGHFASKEALAAEACHSQLLAGAAHWRARVERARAAGRDPLEALVGGYVTAAHRDRPEGGCTLAALGPEIARAGAALSGALGAGTEALLEVLTETIASTRPAFPEDRRRSAAIAMLGAMTGGIILARALAADPDASQAALDGAVTTALGVVT